MSNEIKNRDDYSSIVETSRRRADEPGFRERLYRIIEADSALLDRLAR